MIHIKTFNDIVVLVDGVIAKRWLSDINTNHTHIWFNVNVSAGLSMTLLTPVAATGTMQVPAWEKRSKPGDIK